MCIKPIISRIIPNGLRFGRISEGRKPIQTVNEKVDKFVLNNPELIQKRQAVVKYLYEASPIVKMTMYQPDKIGDYKIETLYDKKIGEILELCGDNLPEIDSALGLYGLAYYADVKSDTIIKKNPGIKEIGYGDTSFRNCFYTYILTNDKGSLSDLYSRFGRMGASLYDDLSVYGCQETGISDYKLSDFAKEILSEDLFAIISMEAEDDIRSLFEE